METEFIIFFFRCETVGLFLECSVEEATKRGLKSSEMLKIIRTPFDLLPVNDQWDLLTPPKSWERGPVIFPLF